MSGSNSVGSGIRRWLAEAAVFTIGHVQGVVEQRQTGLGRPGCRPVTPAESRPAHNDGSYFHELEPALPARRAVPARRRADGRSGHSDAHAARSAFRDLAARRNRGPSEIPRESCRSLRNTALSAQCAQCEDRNYRDAAERYPPTDRGNAA
ncbi:hypothetical protein KM043_008921 [Ampulex compressa]|nr:hypothetical protein KM043_008921 [Ampulex compressa]